MRALRITLIIAVILGGLFVGADRLAVSMAESKAADKIKSSAGADHHPDVSIKGFPFLTQVVGKELDEVDVGVDGLTTDAGDGPSVRVTELTPSCTTSHLRELLVGHRRPRHRLGPHQLRGPSRAAGPGRHGGYDPAGNNQVKITGNLLGFSLTARSSVDHRER